MNTTNEVIDRIKSEHHLPSDYAAAKLLGVSKQSMSKYRNNKNQFSDDVAYRAAELAKLSPFKVIASLQSERKNQQSNKEIWSEMEKKDRLVKKIQNQEVIQAIQSAADGTASPAQRKILAELTELCILCKIGIISKNATFSPIYQNIPKKHLN